MIVSASYRTDIPTFYGEWFLHRLRAGSCRVINPYSRQAYQVSLRREDIDGFVFWTKNVAPFVGALREVRERGFPFVVQHTLNGYPRALETSVVDASRAVDAATRVAAAHGPRVLVWRYDTVVFSSLTPPDFHRENFGRLAEALRGATDEVVVSFLHLYAKTRRNLDQAATRHAFTWRDPDAAEKRELAADLNGIAAANGMRLTLCSQPEYRVDGAGEASCIDAHRLADIAGTAIPARVQGNREHCRCHTSRDIGDYDTCPHGCVYCYAVRSQSLAAERFRRHDPLSEFLFEPETTEGTASSAPKTEFPLS